VTGPLPPRMNVRTAERQLAVAVVYSRTPLPMRRADQLTVAHLLAYLAERGHHVDLFTLATGAKAGRAEKAWLERHCRSVSMVRHGRLRMLTGLFWALVRGLPLQVGIFRNPRLTASFNSASRRTRYDVVYTYYLRSAEVTRRMDGREEGGPLTVLAMQLSQALNTARILENATSLWTRLLYRYEAPAVARYEASVWRDFDQTVLIGEQDVAAVNAAAAAHGMSAIDNFFLCAHGTDLQRFRPRPEAVVPGRVVFSGVMRTPTNAQAVLWFVKHVWPAVRRRVPGASFWIVGREPGPEVRRLQAEAGVIVTGTVPDPAEEIAKAQVCVNPMLAGGGMQNKLLEYLASGKPTVATNVANEGINAPRDCVRLADTAEDFAAAVSELLEDPAEAGGLGERARRFVEATWSWEAQFLHLEEQIEAALSERT